MSLLQIFSYLDSLLINCHILNWCYFLLRSISGHRALPYLPARKVSNQNHQLQWNPLMIINCLQRTHAFLVSTSLSILLELYLRANFFWQSRLRPLDLCRWEYHQLKISLLFSVQKSSIGEAERTVGPIQSRYESKKQKLTAVCLTEVKDCRFLTMKSKSCVVILILTNDLRSAVTTRIVEKFRAIWQLRT